MKKEAENPFYFGRMVREDSFTDRKKDMQRLMSNFRNGINTLLLSPRRWGKSSLVKKAGDKLKEEGIVVVYLDAFSLRNEVDFYTAYTKEILAATSSKWEEWVRMLKQFLEHITPKISMGVAGTGDFSLGFDWESIQRNTDDILNLPNKIAESKGVRMVVCIDEFQNIACFDDSLAFQKRLRSAWQKHEKACYCLYGSKFHMMQELFERQLMPFYRFGDLMHLDKIAEKDWRRFIRERFKKTGKNISNELVKRIVATVDRHSYYVQQLAHLTWASTKKTATEAIFDKALDDMISQNAMLYQRDTENMNATQLNLLKAVATGEKTNLSSNRIITAYRLGTSANVVKVKRNLLNSEIIDVRNKEVHFIDPVYELWFKREILKH
ncbi:MAG: ATP-binding protein [Prevotellaceae bacterium]|jgi:AAA+ ATPase superfamily predicted ATPase|nr:ATP-binding protein [Prevotellaceae bacterium]